MSRHTPPHPSGGWLALALAVVAALGGAAIAGAMAAGPGRVAVGWATALGAAVFLMFWRMQRSTSLRLARLDYSRRRDSVRLREELAEAHHRSRMAVERSYAAVARTEALTAEINRLVGVIAAVQAPVITYVTERAPSAPESEEQPSVPDAASPSVTPPTPAPSSNPAAVPAAQEGPAIDLPLVASRRTPTPSAVPLAPRREAPFVSPSSPAEPERVRVDLRAVEPSRRYARGA